MSLPVKYFPSLHERAYESRTISGVVSVLSLCCPYGVCVFIPFPVRVGPLLMEVPGTPIGASFSEFELKPTGKDSADPTQHEFQHHIL